MLDDFDMDDARTPHEDRPKLQFDAPLKNLNELDTAQELMLQYQRAENLAGSVLTDVDVPPNQRAQVLAAVTAVLSQIIKLQTDLHNSQQFKRIEMIMIDTLKAFPEMQAAFMDAYRVNLDAPD